MKPRRAAIIHRGMHERSAEKKESARMRPITFSIVAVLLVVFLNGTAAHASTQDDVNQAVTIIQLESDLLVVALQAANR